MKVLNQTKNIVLAENAEVARTFLKRLIGLLGRKEFAIGQALVLKPANSIHTFFMAFSIDLIFLDKENRVVKIVPCLKPWRMALATFKTKLAIELPCGTLQKIPTSEGDSLSFI